MSTSFTSIVSQSFLPPYSAETETKEAVAQENTIASVLLPTSILEKIEKDNEEMMVIMSKLIIKSSTSALIALYNKNFTVFDPAVGDAGCEIRAITIYNLATSLEFQKEAVKLKAELLQANIKLEAYCKPQKASKMTLKENPAQFFQNVVAKISISAKMVFLLQAHLVAAATDHQSYTIVNKQLSTFVKGFDHDKFKDIRSIIIENLQGKLSHSSMDTVRIEAEKIKTGLPSELSLINRMLSPESTKIVAQRIRKEKGVPRLINIPPTAFGVTFYKVKAILLRLREECILTAIKKSKIGKEKSFLLLFKSAKPGGPLIQVPDEEYSKLDQGQPMIVLEGVAPPRIDRRQLAERISKHGFSEIILAFGAQAPLYGLDLNLDESDQELAKFDQRQILPDARAEILQYKGKAKEIGCEIDKDPFFNLDHFFCSTLKKELA